MTTDVGVRVHHLRLVPAHLPRPGEHLEALLTEWTTWMQAAGTAERTVGDRVSLVRCLAARSGTDPATAGHATLAEFLAAGGIRPSTRHAYYLRLRAWYRWLVATGRRVDNPTDPLCKPKVPRGRPKPISTAHLQVLLASSMRPRTRAMVLLAAYQGLRVHEIARFRGEHVDLLAMTLTVRGKGGVEAVLPLHPLVAREALKYPRRGWWFPTHVGNRQTAGGRAGPEAAGAGPVLARSVSTVVSDAMARAGVPGSAHSLRHWYGTELLRVTGNARVVQELMRHAQLSTTAVYTLVTMDEERAALGRLPDYGRGV